MPSTVIRHSHYVRERRELFVEFVTGRQYLYADVPEEEASAFKAASSKGRYFNAHIRDCYVFRELTTS